MTLNNDKKRFPKLKIDNVYSLPFARFYWYSAINLFPHVDKQGNSSDERKKNLDSDHKIAENKLSGHERAYEVESDESRASSAESTCFVLSSCS